MSHRVIIQGFQAQRPGTVLKRATLEGKNHYEPFKISELLPQAGAPLLCTCLSAMPRTAQSGRSVGTQTKVTERRSWPLGTLMGFIRFVER